MAWARSLTPKTSNMFRKSRFRVVLLTESRELISLVDRPSETCFSTSYWRSDKDGPELSLGPAAARSIRWRVRVEWPRLLAFHHVSVGASVDAGYQILFAIGTDDDDFQAWVLGL